ncbi:MAG: hypothetical protein ACKVOR_05375 [Flavobacteriales bacterium]
MTKNFQLYLKGVKCLGETFSEWGDDEIMLVGFGITDHGERIFFKPMYLGSFETGDVGYNDAAHPLTLVDTEVSVDTKLISACIYMVEQDNGDVYTSGNALQNAFNRTLDRLQQENTAAGMSGRELWFYSFAQAMTFIRNNIDLAANDWFNDDDLLGHLFKTIKADKPMPWEGPLTFEIVPYPVDGALYALTFEYHLNPAPLVTL